MSARHYLFILIVGLALSYTLFKKEKKPISSQNYSSLGEKPHKVSASHTKTIKLEKLPLKNEGKKAESKPKKVDPSEPIFDETLVVDNYKLDLSEGHMIDLLNEDEDTQTYVFQNRDGMRFERTYWKDGSVLSERWQDNSGGTVERHFYFSKRVAYTDKYGNRFDMLFYDNGQVAEKGRRNADGSGVSYSYNEDGSLQGIYQQAANKSTDSQIEIE